MIIAVVSLKGGVGKTFVATNLATYLYRFHNKKVLLVDVGGKIGNSILFSKVEKIKTNGPLYLNIIITPFFHLRITNNISVHKRDFDLLSRVYDYIILDTPPVYQKIKEAVEIADIILLITNADFFSLYTNYILYKLLPKEKTKIILNRYMKELDIDLIEAIFKKQISAIIPYDKSVIDSEQRLLPVVIYNKNSKAAKAIDELAYLITGKKLRTSILDKIKALFAL